MRKDAISIFYQGLRAVEPESAVKKYCKREKDNFVVGDKTYNLAAFKNLFVIGAGKASAPMAVAIEDLLGERITKGIINVKYDHTAKLDHIELIEAGHPVPDINGQNGAESIFNIAQNAEKDDLIICLISGGGSALLPLPVDGVTLQDKQITVKQLLSCGASIDEMNALRKHISTIKGGRLAQAAYPATIISLMLSDVVGDDLEVISSGPTVPDSSSFQDCLKIIDKYKIIEKLPKSVVNHIKSGVEGTAPETPKGNNPAFDKTHNLIIGSNIEAMIAAKQKAKDLGYNTIILSSMIQGETKYVAQVHGAIAREIVKTGNPVNVPACVLSGGETTVTITGKGLGGRNQEFALESAIEIDNQSNIVILSAGTDGTDGPTQATGATVDTHTLNRAKKMGLDYRRFLADNDSYHFFDKLGDLLITGPTNTNVMDMRIVLAS